MNEGHLGTYSFGGERAATDDHPVVIHSLPLAADVAAKIDVGTLLRQVDGEDGAVAYAPYLSTDAVAPLAVADLPCDPTGEPAETSVCAVVHGTVKTRTLRTGDGAAPTAAQLAVLAAHGVFAV